MDGASGSIEIANKEGKLLIVSVASLNKMVWW